VFVVSFFSIYFGASVTTDKNLMITVAQGMVPVLVRLLDSSSMEMKEKAVVAISRISMVDSSKPVLVEKHKTASCWGISVNAPALLPQQ
jgi:hypothetical protein